MKEQLRAEDYYQQVIDLKETLNKSAPEYLKAYGEFAGQALKEGALSAKTKELIFMALGITAHCPHCIVAHVKGAIEAGATRQEILEAGMVAGPMGGGPALVHLRYVLEACDQFGAD